MFTRAHLIGQTALVSLAMTATAPAFAAPFTITTSNTTARTLAAGELGTVTSTGTLTVGSGTNTTVAVTVTGNGATLDNQGTISQAGIGRAVRDNTGVTGFTINNGSATNALATIKTAGDDAIQLNKASSSATINNYGTITATAGGQALDFAAVTTGATTVNNFSTGQILAKDADAVRPGVNGIVNNAGTIQSIVGTATGDDGIDGQNNSGIQVTNSGTIDAGRHGITNGALNSVVNFAMSVTNAIGGVIKGHNGSGINIDGFNANQTFALTNHGTITGHGTTGDGDGVDVDGVVNITNTGIIESTNAVDPAGSAFSEGISVGGGTITNSGTIRGLVEANNTTAVGRGITLAGNDITSGTNQGDREGLYADATVTNQANGVIKGQSDSGIVVVGLVNNRTVTINNDAGATIIGGGATTAAIQSNGNNTVITNAGAINGASSGKAIGLGGGNDTVNLQTGSSISGAVDGGAGTDTLHLSGTGSLGSTSGFETLNIDGGAWTLTGAQSYTTGNITNGGILRTDPTTISFTTLSVDASGAIQGEMGDQYQIGGDFLNHSTQNTIWDTTQAALHFTGLAGMSHTLLLTGADHGGNLYGTANNFAWASLALDAGNVLALGNGLGGGQVAFYIGVLTGFDVVGDAIANVIGNGFNIFYNTVLNPELSGRTYALANGGSLIAYDSVPAPASLALLGLGLLPLFRRKRDRK